MWVTGPIRWRESATVRAFKFLKANCKTVPKVTLPAPLILHMFGGGDKGILEGHYKDIEAFWADVVAAYRAEVKALVEAGATYIQFDDTSIAFLCDPLHRELGATLGLGARRSAADLRRADERGARRTCPIISR